MRFLPKCGLSWISVVVVCALEIISTFGLHNETTKTSLLPPSVFERDFATTNVSREVKKLEDMHFIISNGVNNKIFAISSKRSRKNRWRKISRNRKKRKGVISTTVPSTIQVHENKPNATTINVIKKKRRRKHRRRKNRKYRRKQKLENNNILEVTTAKGLVFPTNTTSNSTINELIRKLNQNPEDSFDDFHLTHGNKTLPSMIFKGEKLTNLITPIDVSAHYPILLNDNITLHVSVGNTTSHKSYPKRYNRCRKNKGGCAHYCNPKGKIKCSCIEGFVLAKDQKSCLDINECRLNNGGCEMKCINTLGSFECHCSVGLRLADDSKRCEDVNECLLRNGHGPCQDTCENSYGSYRCSCVGLNGTKLSEDGHSCVDLDECARDNGGCSHKCINTVGRAFCTCPDGMELSSDWKSCQDINECEDESIQRTCKNGCINTDGSYLCVDLSDYQSDQSSRKVTCKPLFPPARGFIACSRDGAAHSYTKRGRRRITNSPGTTCKLVCPIGYKMVGEFFVTCGFSGEWEGKQEAKCIGTSTPVLQCPPTQIFKADQESKQALINFPSPKTNINWKYVKSYPPWAKDLTGALGEGRYNIHFTVEDPSTKLVASCSFKVIVIVEN